jgi:hypothetical protein
VILVKAHGGILPRGSHGETEERFAEPLEVDLDAEAGALRSGADSVALIHALASEATDASEWYVSRTEDLVTASILRELPETRNPAARHHPAPRRLAIHRAKSPHRDTLSEFSKGTIPWCSMTAVPQYIRK